MLLLELFMNRSIKNMGLFFLLLMVILPFVYAGVGISWDKESSLIPEKTETCLTYKIYNPWPKDSYVKIQLSDSLQEIVESADAEFKLIPKETSSLEAMPVTFCFKTPNVYPQDCLVGNFLCKQECGEDMKVYEGEVEVIEVSEKEALTGGSGGSTTTMSVSAPLRVKVQCVAHGRDYSLVYIIIAIIAAGLIGWDVYRIKKKKKGKKK